MTVFMRAIDPMIGELEQEAVATRQLLEAIPADKLSWRPHAKSMTVGQLAYHIAGIWGGISSFLELDGFDVNNADFTPADPESKEQILEQLDESVTIGRARLNALDDELAAANWVLSKGGTELATMPKLALARSLMMNHLYHHRGQLSVYLRLLEVPVPVSYGRTADVNPFA